MLFYNNLFLNYYKILNTGGGIRTHEADAWDLESHPFDRSGTPVQLNDAPTWARTRDLEVNSLTL